MWSRVWWWVHLSLLSLTIDTQTNHIAQMTATFIVYQAICHIDYKRSEEIWQVKTVRIVDMTMLISKLLYMYLWVHMPKMQYMANWHDKSVSFDSSTCIILIDNTWSNNRIHSPPNDFCWRLGHTLNSREMPENCCCHWFQSCMALPTLTYIFVQTQFS